MIIDGLVLSYSRDPWPHGRLSLAEHEWLVPNPSGGEEIELVAVGGNETLDKAQTVVLRGGPYPTEEAAQTAGSLWEARLMRAFAGIKVGADFGDRAPKGAFTQRGFQFVAAGQRALNDVHGLMVFECDPPPVFVGMGPVTAFVSSGHEALVQAMEKAVSLAPLTDEQQVAYDFFSASFNANSADARLDLLMMAVESLIEPRPRSQEVRRHVEGLIEQTAKSGLPESEVLSISTSLTWLLDESIGQAGRRLARHLEPRTYMNLAPDRFFTKCYGVRSQLLHGEQPPPSWAEVCALAASLECFVADLITQA